MGWKRVFGICLSAVLVLTLACRTAGAPAAAPAARAAAPSPVEGLWEGVLVYKAAELEPDINVELARQAGGRWAGTIDVPNQQIKYQPVTDISADGSQVSFVFTRYSETAAMTVVSTFTGTVSADGSTMSGIFLEGGKNRIPFTLVRKGDAGSDRHEPSLGTLHLLSADGKELKAAFNRDQDKVRLVMLLSPT